MEVSNLQRKVSAADIPLDRMTDSKQVSDQQKLGEVSRQFEAILLRQILSEAQKSQATMKGKAPSAVSDIYHDMVTNQLADSISRSGSVGMAKVLEKQLGRQLQPSGVEAATKGCEIGRAHV